MHDGATLQVHPHPRAWQEVPTWLRGLLQPEVTPASVEPAPQHQPPRLRRPGGRALLASLLLVVVGCSGGGEGGAGSTTPAAKKTIQAELQAGTACTAQAPASSTERAITLSLNGCAGVQRFQVSESPDFTLPVTVNISQLAADASSAQLSVSYGTGTAGAGAGPSQAYAVPAAGSQTVRVLAVVFSVVDDNGQTNGPGDYETPTWINRMVFGDGTVGADGQLRYNSFKDHVAQSTNGAVTLTGRTYPRVLKLPLEPMRRFLTASTPGWRQSIVQAIRAEDPNFLDQEFDLLMAVSSSVQAVRRGVWHLDGEAVIMAAPIDAARSILDDTLVETRRAVDARRVVTRFNPGSVTGVWLASDTSRSGTNFFSGGAISTAGSAAGNEAHIALGTTLPTADALVQVEYKPRAVGVVPSSQPDTLATGDNWQSTFFHETYHVLSRLRGFRQGTRWGIGDLYRSPNLLPGLDLMSTDGLTVPYPQGGPSFYTPALLSAPNRFFTGFVSPRTLAYGSSESGLTLARAGFADAQAMQQTTVIKVPLRPRGDPGFATRNQGSWVDSVGIAEWIGSTQQFSGEQYLLLELRSRAALPGGRFNFDSGVLSAGVVAYHVLESDPYSSTGGTSDVVEQIDATPPTPGGFSSVAGSAAAFGTESGVMSFAVPELWQDKPLANASHSATVLLSAGSGSKTLYVRFADASGALLGSTQVQVELTGGGTAAQRLPTVSARLGQGYGGVYDRYVGLSFSAPNGARGAALYLDGRLVSTRGLSGSSGDINFNFDPRAVSTGNHVWTVQFHDIGRNLATAEVAYSEGQATTLSAPQSLSLQEVLANRAVRLSWAAPTFGALSLLDVYEVWRDGERVAVTESTEYSDAGLVPGATHRWKVRARARDGSTTAYTAELSYTVAGDGSTGPCVRSAALLAANPSSLALQPGGSSSITLTLTNANSASCESSSFTLQAQAATPWSASISPASLTLAPGSSAQAVVAVDLAASTGGATSGTLTLVAQDGGGAAGNGSASVPLAVVLPVCVPGTPQLTLTPANAALVAGQDVSLAWSLRNADSSACTSTRFDLAGSLPAGWSGTLSASSVTLAPGGQASGSWVLQSPAGASSGVVDAGLTVQDGSRSVQASSALSVTAAPDTTPPTVRIVAPANGSTVGRNGPVTVTAEASDTRGVTEVSFALNGVVQARLKQAPYQWAWDARRARKGDHTITVSARDAAGNSASTSITVKR